MKSADGDVELAEFGIVYVDEIDKIASESSRNGKDVSGRGVQINLLKLMEETEVGLHAPQDMMGQMKAFMDMQKGSKPKKNTISTRNILFIVSGAFDQLGENIRKRLNLNRIGFGSAEENLSSDESSNRFLSQAETKDFIDYGFEPEFIGRLPVRVACEELTKEDLAEILNSSEGNVLEQYKNDFLGYDINVQIEKDAIDKIAEKAALEKTGARGLVTVLEKTFRDFKFELPSTAIRDFSVCANTVENPNKELEILLEEKRDQLDDSQLEDVDRFAESFKKESGFTLKFRKNAKIAIVKESISENRSVRAICDRKFSDFVHGLGIINQRTGKKEFIIDKKVVDDPDKELSEWVVESFGKQKET